MQKEFIRTTEGIDGETPEFTGGLAINGTSVGMYNITSKLQLSNTDTFDANNYTLVVDETVIYEIEKYEPAEEVTPVNDWINVDTVELKAPEGFEISQNNALPSILSTINTGWTDTITVDTEAEKE